MLRRFEPESLGVDFQDDTTELQDSIEISNNIILFITTNVPVILAHPPLNQFVCYTIFGGGHFPPKNNENCLPCFLYKSFFYGYSYTKLEAPVPVTETETLKFSNLGHLDG